MTDDVMKKVESLLFDEDDEEVQLQEIKEEVPEETVEEPIEKEIEKEEVKQKKNSKEEKPNKTFTPKRENSMDFVEIFFDGRMEIQGARIKIVPGSEVESGNLKFVFGDDSVKVYEI